MKGDAFLKKRDRDDAVSVFLHRKTSSSDSHSPRPLIKRESVDAEPGISKIPIFQRVLKPVCSLRRSRRIVLLSVSVSMIADMAFCGYCLSLWDPLTKNYPDNAYMYSMYGVGLVACSLFSGIISDVMNSRRRPSIVGILFGMVAVCLCLFDHVCPANLYISRLFHGFSSSIVYVVCMSLVPDTFPSKYLASALATTYCADYFGQLLGPAIFWMVVNSPERDYQYGYIVLAAIYGIDLFLRLFIRPVNVFAAVARKRRKRRKSVKYLDWQEDDTRLQTLYESEEGIESSSLSSRYSHDEKSTTMAIESDVEKGEDILPSVPGESASAEEFKVYDAHMTMSEQVNAWIDSLKDNVSVIGTDDGGGYAEESSSASSITSVESDEEHLSATEELPAIEKTVMTMTTAAALSELPKETGTSQVLKERTAALAPRQRAPRKKKPKSKHRKRHKRRKRRPLTFKDMNPLTLLKHTEIIMCCVTVMLGAMGITLNEYVFYPMAKDKFSLSDFQSSCFQVCFLLPAIVISILLGSFSDRIRGSRLVIIGFILHIMAPPFIPLAPTLPLLIVACCFYSISRTILLMPVIAEMGFALTYLGESNSIAKVYGLYNCSYGVGMLIASKTDLFSFVYKDGHNTASFYAFPVLNLVLLLIYVLFSLRVERKRQGRPFAWKDVFHNFVHDLFYDPWRRSADSDGDQE